MFSIKHLLPKFKPHSFHDKKMKVLWLRYLTEIDEKTRTAREELLANPETRKALDIIEESAYTDAQMAGYDHFWEAVSWERTLVSAAMKRSEQAHKKGYEVGLKMGMEKGILSERLRNAKVMKRMNVPLDTIIQVTGLSKEEIDRL